LTKQQERQQVCNIAKNISKEHTLVGDIEYKRTVLGRPLNYDLLASMKPNNLLSCSNALVIFYIVTNMKVRLQSVKLVNNNNQLVAKHATLSMCIVKSSNVKAIARFLEVHHYNIVVTK
jgi:hypothetical protein